MECVVRSGRVDLIGSVVQREKFKTAKQELYTRQVEVEVVRSKVKVNLHCVSVADRYLVLMLSKERLLCQKPYCMTVARVPCFAVYPGRCILLSLTSLNLRHDLRNHLSKSLDDHLVSFTTAHVLVQLSDSIGPCLTRKEDLTYQRQLIRKLEKVFVERVCSGQSLDLGELDLKGLDELLSESVRIFRGEPERTQEYGVVGDRESCL